MSHMGLKMNLPHPTRHFLTAYIMKSFKDRDVKFSDNFDSSLIIKLSKFIIDIFDSLVVMRFAAS